MSDSRSIAEALLNSEKIPVNESKIVNIEQPSLAALKKRKKELFACLDILETQMRKQYGIRIIYNGAMATAITVSGWHIAMSKKSYEAAFDYLKNTFVFTDPNGAHTCDGLFGIDKWLQILFNNNPIFANIVRDGIHSPQEFAQAGIVNFLDIMQSQMLSDIRNIAHVCSDAVNEILSGPGMWNGYLPVIIIFGLIIPALLAASELYYNYASRLRCLPNELSVQQYETVTDYIWKYIKHTPESTLVTPTLKELKKLFEDDYIQLQADINFSYSRNENNYAANEQKNQASENQPEAKSEGSRVNVGGNIKMFKSKKPGTKVEEIPSPSVYIYSLNM